MTCNFVFVINKAGLDKISIISDLCTPIRNSEIKEEPHLEVGQPQLLRLPHERGDVDRDGLPLIRAEELQPSKHEWGRVEILRPQPGDGTRNEVEQGQNRNREAHLVEEQLQRRGIDHGVARDDIPSVRSVEREIQEGTTGKISRPTIEDTRNQEKLKNECLSLQRRLIDF